MHELEKRSVGEVCLLSVTESSFLQSFSTFVKAPFDENLVISKECAHLRCRQPGAAPCLLHRWRHAYERRLPRGKPPIQVPPCAAPIPSPPFTMPTPLFSLDEQSCTPDAHSHTHYERGSEADTATLGLSSLMIY